MKIYWHFHCSLACRIHITFTCFWHFQFKAISQAYEVLSDAKKREIYDRGGEQAIREGGVSEDMHSPMDLFEMFFGMGGGTHLQRGPRRGKDVIHKIPVTLEELYVGSVRKLSIQKNVVCKQCSGMKTAQFLELICYIKLAIPVTQHIH